MCETVIFFITKDTNSELHQEKVMILLSYRLCKFDVH